MDRITKLKGEVASLECLVGCAKGNLTDFEGRLAERRKQIAALEAESKKPREYVIGIDDTGQPVSVGLYGGGILYHVAECHRSPKMLIGVIEKRPIVITKAMAAKFSAVWAASGNTQREAWERQTVATVEALKAINIDAVAAEE